MIKTRKILSAIFSAIVALFLTVAIFLSFPKNEGPASAYDEVGPSFTSEKSHTYSAASDFAISNNVLSGLSATALATVGQYDTITLNIPSGVTSIAKDAFYNEDNYGRRIVEVIIPDTVTTIGESAFSACQKMMHLQLGSKVTTIGNNAFLYCYKLVDIYNRSNLTLTAGKTDYGQIALYAMNIYTSSSGSSMLAKTDDNYYFCQFTSTATRTLATQAETGKTRNYENGKWYLVAGAHINGKDNALPAGSFTVNYVKKSGSAQISTYDIGTRAFWMSFATKLVIPNCVNVIGDYAFGFSFFYKAVIQSGGSGTLYIGARAFYLYSSITVQEGNSQYFDPEIGQASRIGQEVYLSERDISCAADSFMAPLSDNTATIYSAIVYPSRELYLNKKSQINGGAATITSSENSSVSISNYITYPIDINYHIYDKNNNPIETVTEQRLYRANGKWGYNYVEGTYGYRASSSYATLPNVDVLNTEQEYHYSATYWYLSISNAGFGSAADVAYLNTQLAKSDITSVDLYMKYIAKPDLEMIDEEWDYTGQTFNTVAGIDGLLQGTPLADTNGWHVDYKIEYEGETVSEIKNVGTYTLTLIPDSDFESLYGKWDSTPSVTFTINKAKVDLTNSENVRLVEAGTKDLLQSGTVYIYEESGSRVPYASVQDGKTLIRNEDVTWSYIRNKAGLSGIELQQIPVNETTKEEMFSAADYTTTPSVNGVGIYTTSVTITPTSNYELYYPGYSQEIQSRGLEFRAGQNGEYTVIKTWYIVAISNWFVQQNDGEEGDAYATHDSVYNAAPDFEAPYLAHGEQSNITFELSYTTQSGKTTDLTNGSPVALGLFSDYINQSMPVGKYTLVFHAEEYTDETLTVYPAFSTSYEFTVSASAALRETHAATINNVLQGVEFRYLFEEGAYRLYTGESVEKAINGVLNTQINNRTGIWEDSAYDEYYSDSFAISFNLYRMQSNNYYSENELKASGYAPVNPGTYVVYYQFTALNYEDMVAVSNDVGRREYNFTVFIYDYVEIPYDSIAAQKNGLVYTGSSVTPVVQGSDLYSLSWNSNDAYINAGEHSFTLNMADPEHYYWIIPENPSEEWTKNVTVGLNADGSQRGDVVIGFTIAKAENVWNSTPNVISWSWSGFVPETNVIRAVPRYNLYVQNGEYVTVRVSYIVFDANKQIVVPEFETVNGVVTDTDVIATLKSLDAGLYYLMAFAQETDNFLGINVSGGEQVFSDDAYVAFNILQAVNRWSNTPNVIHWTWDRFDANEHLITAVPEFGELVNYYIYTLGANGEKIFLTFGTENGEDIICFHTDSNGRVPENVADVLARLDAGTYYLIANVQPTKNYTGLYEIGESGEDGEITVLYPDGMSFAVFKASNKWNKSPSMSGWMWNSFSFDSVAVVADPTYKTKADGTPVSITFVLYSKYESASSSNNVALTRPFMLVDGKLPETFLREDGTSVSVAEFLNGLNRGDYYLVASVEDGGNFEALSDSAVVTVSVLTNSWVYTPAINGWEWGAFDATKNTVFSTPLFNGSEFFADNTGYASEQVTYYIYKENANGIKVLVEGFENGFKVDANGVIVADDALTALLKGLPAGRYYLLATLAADDSEYGNYTGINVSDNLDYIAFNVAQAGNYWETSPSMTGWQYYAFATDSNFVAGVPHYRGENTVVTYSLYDGKGTLLKEFTNIDEVVRVYLVGRVVGQYSLIATAEGTSDYSGLETTITFRVTQNTLNAWVDYPTVSGWTYGESSASNVTEARATFGSVTYTVALRNGSSYENVTGFVGLTLEDLQKKLSQLNAGSYSLTVVSAQAGLADGQEADYVAAERTLYFEIAKAANAWVTVPSLSGWTWGDPAQTPSLGEPLQDTTVGGVYYKAKSDGSLGEKLSDAPKAAGLYAFLVTAEECTNYRELTYTVYFQIEQYKNGWTVKPEITLFWTWGDAIDASWNLVRAAAEKGDVAYVITGEKANGESIATVTTNAEGIVKALQALGAGTYNIMTSVTGSEETFTNLETPTSVTVNKGTLAWKAGTAPDDVTWVWTPDYTNTFTAPVAVGTVQGNAVEIGATYSVVYRNASGSESNSSFTSASDLEKYLKEGDAGVYTVTVSVNDSNYNSLTGTATVTIEQAENAWTVNEPSNTSGYYREFKEAHLPAPKSKFGSEVQYLYLGSPLTVDPIEWMNGLNAGKHTLTVAVAGTNNYPALQKDITVTVLPVSRSWSNQSDLQENYGFTFNGTVANVVIPVMASLDKNGKVTYTFEYNGDSTAVVLPEGDDLTPETLATYFKTVRDAGTYIITANYDSGDDNIQSLTYKVSVKIAKAAVNWKAGTMPPEMSSFTYQGADLTIPDANGHAIEYTVIDSNNISHAFSVGEDSTYASINAYLNTLSVGTYTLISKVAETANYLGLEQTTSVIIIKATNGWAANHAPSNDSIVRGGQIVNFVEPQAQRGNDTLTITISGGALTASVNQPASALKGYLESLNAGVYTIKYSVSPDANNNYDGFTAETIFTVSLQSNEWVTILAESYTETWSDSGVTGIPTPSAQKGEVKFDITSLTQGVTVPAAGCSAAAFEEWLKTASAGTYSVKYYVEATVDYAGLTERTATVAIAKKTNTVVSSVAEINWNYGGSGSVQPTFTAEYGTENIVYYINGVKISASFLNALNALPVGEYTLRAEVAESTNYLVAYTDVKLVVVQGANAWMDGYDLEMIESSDGSSQRYTGWQWDSPSENIAQTVILNAPRALRGNDVTITVSLVEGSTKTVVETFVLTYTVHDDGSVTSNLESLNARLRALNAGNYEIKAEIPASTNWSIAGVESKTVAFKVLKNTNEWLNGEPPVVQNWTYGSDRNLPRVGGVKYGSVNNIVYTYYYGTEVKTANIVNDFNKAGTYTFTATMAASPDGNYDALTYTGTFEVEKLKGGWQTAAGITGWTWNEFDPAKNLFVGSAHSGAQVVFKILDSKNNVVAEGLVPDQNGAIADSGKLDILQNANVMLAGTYTFVAEAAETDNYLKETAEGTFTVRQAQNRWITYPRIKMWAENLWSSDTNMPVVQSLYGNVVITITGKYTNDDGTVTENYVYFEATYDSDGNLIENTRNRLPYAVGGEYVLRGRVEGVDTKYTTLDDSTVIEIFLSSEARPANYWKVYPKISNWTAGDAPAVFEYTAYRGNDVVITFYYAQDGAKLGIVAASELDANGFPAYPGEYVMNIVSNFYDGDDLVEFDRLEEDIAFTVRKRIIEWTVTPNITDWQLSGDPSRPVAGFNFGDEAESTLTFLYKLVSQSDEEAVSELPKQPGEYVMIVTATAKYCDPVEARVEFNVTLAKNSWKEIPVIEGWSEEFDPNNPLGQAEFGEVVYTYRNAAGEVFTELPTKEGTYVLCATVEVEGYETLYAEYEFVVEAAFDTTLLTVDIVLASVLCMISLVVIVFAIRRYREC